MAKGSRPRFNTHYKHSLPHWQHVLPTLVLTAVTEVQVTEFTQQSSYETENTLKPVLSP